jgi:hypothetical protein
MYPGISSRTEGWERSRLGVRLGCLDASLLGFGWGGVALIRQLLLWGVMPAVVISVGMLWGGLAFGQQRSGTTVDFLGNGVDPTQEGSSGREAKLAAVRSIPYGQLTSEAAARVRTVVDDASYFRRMPTQSVDCDLEMYQFLVRHPEVVVNLWDLMGITKVSLKRTGEYQLVGNDGAGTTCKMDLIYGSDTLHIYQSQGGYQGSMWPRELKGHCVVVLHNRQTQLADGRAGMVAWMDAFMRLENVGADLVVKTLGPMMGKTADHNFVECANFFSQIAMTARLNPQGLQQVAGRLKGLSPEVRSEFIRTAAESSMRQGKVIGVQQALTQGIATSTRRMVSKRSGADPKLEGFDEVVVGESPTIHMLTNEGEFDPKP